ncbi:hypothetical protein COT60_03815 [Candidatus Pacearchaeota archaeon CG09_land_8_20_14_0_10_30_9]|nr:MAG: hypothetical protein COT60_03815 [Candidatus Pacearchaeota archaeon CG09_land_8_20_14_0_10_30_9]
MKKQIISKSVQKECSGRMAQLISYLLDGNTGTIGSIRKEICVNLKPASKRTVSRNLGILVGKGVAIKKVYLEGQLNVYTLAMEYKKSNLREICLTLDLKEPLN